MPGPGQASMQIVNVRDGCEIFISLSLSLSLFRLKNVVSITHVTCIILTLLCVMYNMGDKKHEK